MCELIKVQTSKRQQWMFDAIRVACLACWNIVRQNKMLVNDAASSLRTRPVTPSEAHINAISTHPPHLGHTIPNQFLRTYKAELTSPVLHGRNRPEENDLSQQMPHRRNSVFLSNSTTQDLDTGNMQHSNHSSMGKSDMKDTGNCENTDHQQYSQQVGHW